jgi:TetR/AcrR family transcriptional regulator
MPTSPPKTRSATGSPRKAVAKVKKAAWDARPQSRTEQRLIKEEVLYETAARWFGRHGFHGTSLSDLAKELGIAKANLYNYVQDKSELLYRLHLRSLDVAETAHRTAVAEGRNGLERVAFIARNYVRAVTTSVAVSVIVVEDGALPPAQAEEILTRRRWLEHDLRHQIALGVADKSITPCDPKLMSMNVAGILHWTSRWYIPGGDWSGDQIAEATMEMVSRMLASKPGKLTADVSTIPKGPGDIR